MTRLPFILQRLKLNLNGMGSDVTLNWIVRSGGTIDPGTQAMVGGTVTPQTAVVKGIVYFSEAKSELRQFVEIEVGDAILDLPGDVDVDGKENLRFTIDGQIYEQKELGGELARAWDLLVKNQRGTRTVLVRKAP